MDAACFVIYEQRLCFCAQFADKFDQLGLELSDDSDEGEVIDGE